MHETKSKDLENYLEAKLGKFQLHFQGKQGGNISLSRACLCAMLKDLLNMFA